MRQVPFGISNRCWYTVALQRAEDTRKMELKHTFSTLDETMKTCLSQLATNINTLNRLHYQFCKHYAMASYLDIKHNAYKIHDDGNPTDMLHRHRANLLTSTLYLVG
jgi:hypothetical protein